MENINKLKKRSKGKREFYIKRENEEVIIKYEKDGRTRKGKRINNELIKEKGNIKDKGFIMILESEIVFDGRSRNNILIDDFKF